MPTGNDKTEPRTIHQERVRQVALATPAVRTVVVNVCRNNLVEGATFDAWVQPVLAIRSAVMDCYIREVHGKGRHIASRYSHEEMLNDGWCYTGLRTGCSAIVCQDSHGVGLIGHDDTGATASNVAKMVVACTWPESEDSAKLAPIIEWLTEDLQFMFSTEGDE